MKYVLILISIFLLTNCDNNYENIIDNEQIFGTWHRYSYTESGIETIENDSIIYHFINDGRLIIKYFPKQGASPPDDNYEFDYQDGTLRYWNTDYNVSVESETTVSGSTMRINMYSNFYYNLSKLF